MRAWPAEPRVTTVIPTFNRVALLERAIRSAQQQTFPHIRIAVHDNASTDGTEELVHRLSSEDARITYLRQSTNRGLLANYNHGIGSVTTEYFSFLADDDILLPDFYAKAVEALDSDPEAMFFAGRTVLDNQHLRLEQMTAVSWSPGRYEPSTENLIHVIRDHFIGTGCLFRSTIRNSIGLFDRCASDRNYVIAAAARHPFIVTADAVVRFTIHAVSFSGGGVSEGGGGLRFDGNYVLELYEELEARLRRDGFVTGDDGRRILAAAWGRYRRDIRWMMIARSLPAGSRADLEAVVKNRARYRVTRFDAAALRIALWVIDHHSIHKLVARTLSFAHRFVARLRERRSVR